MCERWILKKNGKNALRNFWGSAVLVLIIYAAISGLVSMLSGADQIRSILTNMYHSEVVPASAGMFSFRYVLSILLSIFVASPLSVGVIHFFSRSRIEKTNWDDMFCVFKNGTFMNVGIVLFLENLFVTLWSLLFIVPGIVKSYEYYMIPYILADDPDMDRHEAFARSKRLTDGYKWDIFLFDLSFLPWYLLGVITCGIAFLYVAPYKQAATVELYECLKANCDNQTREFN